MKYYELTKEEENLLKDFEQGDFESILEAQDKEEYLQIAKSSLSKTKNVNIRVSEKDLLKVKARAAEKGVPYQTLLSSLIHQYSSDKLPDQLP